tara:strand:+ start:3050 stop:4000 length:951 start_codon:yes stop_codon:yes gene_type:complete
MTQRANLHDTSIYAFQADDDAWASWKEQHKANNLTLPCCGGAAVPREHPASGTRFFSHAPYAARTCLWKATGALHEDLVREACDVLQQIGWNVETDCWLEDVAVDIVATNPETDERVAVMIETASHNDRPDKTLIAENARLDATDLRGILWFVPSQRYGKLERQLSARPFQRSEHNADNTVGDVARQLRSWFERINDVTRQIDNYPSPPPQPVVVTTAQPAQMPVPLPIGITGDADWSNGHSSLGSGDVRAARITRLANRWLDAGTVTKWLNKEHPDISYGNTPLGAAQCSASGYLEAQAALKNDLDEAEQPRLID